MPPILEAPRRELSGGEWLEETCLVESASNWRRYIDFGWEPRRPAARIRQVGAGGVTPEHAQVDLEVRFEDLADAWERETAFESVVTRQAMHPAYQRIIGMGDAAVPLILRRLRREPHQWFWALTAITGADPAEGETGAQEAADAWLDWGRAKGLVFD